MQQHPRFTLQKSAATLEAQKAEKVYDPLPILGITTLDDQELELDTEGVKLSNVETAAGAAVVVPLRPISTRLDAVAERMSGLPAA